VYPRYPSLSLKYGTVRVTVGGTVSKLKARNVSLCGVLGKCLSNIEICIIKNGDLLWT